MLLGGQHFAFNIAAFACADTDAVCRFNHQQGLIAEYGIERCQAAFKMLREIFGGDRQGC